MTGPPTRPAAPVRLPPSAVPPRPSTAAAPLPIEVRPSLRAAADLPLRIGGALVGLVLPFAVFALIDASREGAPIEPWAIVLGAALTPELLLALGAAFVPAIRLAFTRYVFSADGLTVRTRVFAATEQRVPWAKVTALRHRRTIIDRLLGIERVDVIAYGVRGTTVHLVGLRPAAPLRDLISAHMRRTATVRSLFEND